MATILFEGTEFNIANELTAGTVLGVACVRYGEAGDYSRFKLFDVQGCEVEPSEPVGKRRLALCDVRKLRDYTTHPALEEYRLAAGGK
jgi:hypothetical protein